MRRLLILIALIAIVGCEDPNRGSTSTQTPQPTQAIQTFDILGSDAEDEGEEIYQDGDLPPADNGVGDE